MLETVMRQINNYFQVEKVVGTYTVQNGSITLPFLKPGQHFRVIGSIYNDGVYRYGDSLDLTDETFDGCVWALAVPKAFLALVDEITAYQTKNGEPGPYTSESFGGYSYSKAVTSKGVAVGWQEVFSSRLGQWRRIGGI